MTWGQMILYSLFGLLACWRLIPLILRWTTNRGDSNRGTEFHHAPTIPIARLGGVALAAAFAVVALAIHVLGSVPAANADTFGVVVFSSLAMFGLGFWDDVSPLGARFKLAGQIVIAASVYFCGIKIEVLGNPFTGVDLGLGGCGFIATVFWLVTLTNLINLIDGMDGLAGGICLMLMCLLASVGTGVHSGFPMLLSAGMAGALLGFLRFNYPPAKIHMGDGGAYFLGFLIGILSIVNSHKGAVAAALIAPLFALALPIVDVSLAILRRGLRGLPLFRPDQKHIHHQLIAFGFSRGRTVLILHAVSFLCLFLALGVFWSQGRLLPLFIGFLFLILAIAGRSCGFTRDWFGLAGQLGQSRVLRKETRCALVLSRWLELQAERCDSVHGLWRDYQFVVNKFGFSRVRLVLKDGADTWNLDGYKEETGRLQHICHEMSGGTIIEFSADKAVLPEKLFELLAELAAETWHKAALRWQGLNHAPLHFAEAGIIPRKQSSRACAPAGLELWNRNQSLGGKEAIP
jgi:UDP-GlcNAc:undecaprenyl-phosphate GlcNAc-1-phosphate transferase